MKNLNLFLVAAALLTATVAADAQTAANAVDRATRAEAKSLEQDGWAAMQGTPALAQQVAESRRVGQDTAADGAGRWFTATATATAGNYTAAKQLADSRAREDLAAAIHAALVRRINDRAAAVALDAKDLAAIKEYAAASRPLILQQLQDVSSVMEIYRETGKTCEVRVQLKVDAASAVKSGGQALQTDLGNRSPGLAAGLAKLLAF